MTPEELHPFHIKESHMAEGITADYVWYESSMIRNALESNLHRFDKVVSVMEARHKEHIKMLQDVMDQNRDLKIQNRALKAVIDATNMAGDPAGLKLRKKPNEKK
jgi:hypothetical protein